METPNYIKALLIPNGHKPKGRKVWSIDLETVWLPFYTATNTMGETHISPDALGAPLRLGYDADGSVKFSKTGRPVVKVAKELSDNIRLVRENFSASLISYANGVIAENPEGYKEQVEQARQAGEPIVKKDNERLQQALAKKVEEELAKAKADELAKAQAQRPKETPKPKEKVLATA
jgi:septum formation inhibitor MinC